MQLSTQYKRILQPFLFRSTPLDRDFTAGGYQFQVCKVCHFRKTSLIMISEVPPCSFYLLVLLLLSTIIPCRSSVHFTTTQWQVILSYLNFFFSRLNSFFLLATSSEMCYLNFLPCWALSCGHAAVCHICSVLLVGQMIQFWETQFLSLGGEDTLEKGMAIHSLFFPGEFYGQRSLVH